MKEIDFEFSNDFFKKALGIMVFSFVVFMIIWSLFFKNNNSIINESISNLLNEKYKGVVVSKYYDKENHNNPIIEFKDEKVGIFGEYWSVIKKGDSLVKNRNELFITVYRGKEKFILDYKPILEELKKKR